MDPLPSSIEAYLEEAGFSGTEIVVLKKLLEEDALTLREIAAKTGKSTGVLDQAVKKLLSKKILSRESINDTPKYVLKSLDTVLAWLQDDMSSRQQMMVRKHENFEMYVRSLANDKKRPDLEHFEGKDGMCHAYRALLERGNDIVQYGPTLYLAEEDPLREFRVQYFRERRSRGIFSRVITHNTPMGRRFQSRDPFEYRKTILVEPHDYPFAFEKIIVGDTVACFQLEENRACFIKYPELAQQERLFFERLWNKKIETQPASAETIERVEAFEKKPFIPLKTKTYSHLREFFVSPKSIIALAACAVLATAVTFVLYKQNATHNMRRIQERLLSIAATGALQFDAAELEEIRILKDVHKPEYPKLVYQLNQIRNQNEGVKYAYLMRHKQGSVWEFIADADAADPFTPYDVDGDGVMTGADENGYPGRQYDTMLDAQNAYRSLFTPVAFEAFIDQWGYIITAWAPIYDAQGNAIGILGIDVDASAAKELNNNSFVPFASFSIFFLLFIFIRLAAFNRQLLKEIMDILKRKKVMLLLLAGGVIAATISLSLYYYHVQSNVARIKDKIASIATTGSLQFTAEDLNQLHSIQDVETEAYHRTMTALDKIRSQNMDIKYAYIIRPNRGSTMFEFIADADALGMKPGDVKDINNDGTINDADELAFPGHPYDIAHIEPLARGEYFTPTVTDVPYTDKWGTVFTGYAPIKEFSGSVSGILAIDVDVQGAYAVHYSIFFPLIAYALGAYLYVLFGTSGFRKTLLFALMRRVASRRVLTTVAFILMGAYWLTFGLYFYTLHMVQEETGKRLMAIATTAAAQINPLDLELLRFARDMQREEYQRVYRQLNDVRDKNPEITFIYIMRPAPQEGVWDFIVDADSNYFIPFNELDTNQDNSVDQYDENVSPGVAYYMGHCCPITSVLGMDRPLSEKTKQDQWGETIAGSAPIFYKNQAVAALMIDVNLSQVLKDGKIRFLRNLLLAQTVALLLIVLYRFLRKGI